MWNLTPLESPQSGTSLVVIERYGSQKGLVIGVLYGFARRLHPPGGQWHSQYGHFQENYQAVTNTTTRESEHMFPLWTIGKRLPGDGFDRSSGKPVATLCPARFENRTACAGTHAMAETMLLGAATVVWLESTFHAPLLSSAPS
jgi:hypothetical protein